MQIPIINGIYTDSGPDIRTNYPVNLIPVPQESGLSAGYLKPADGIISQDTGPGTDRGGINWNNVLYRVMGSKLVSIDNAGATTTLGDVGNDTKLVTFDYSFDRLAIWSNENLFYWNGAALTQVTDVDLGDVIDGIWIDGYFMSTDGEYLIVTELADPTSVSATKYGSSEIDPDPVEALLKLRNEAYAINRYTTEVFDNIGGSGFPFQVISGAQIQKGAVGTHACCVYLETIAFLGSSRNEQPSVYLGVNGQAQQIATREIDLILEEYTETQLATVNLEARNDKNNSLLYMHLPDITLVYDHMASQMVQKPVWFKLSSSLTGTDQYLGQNMIYAYEQWNVGNPSNSAVGYFTDTVGSHWGDTVGWEFGTSIIYNEGRGAIFNEIELSGLTGRIALGDDPQISTSYSLDGQSWSQDRYISAGTIGNRLKRLVWRTQGTMRNFRMQRFKGDSTAHLSFARLEAQLEPLAN